jgi:hypothetical protein
MWPPEEISWIVATLQSIDLFSLDPTQVENYKADIKMLVESMSRESIGSNWRLWGPGVVLERFHC